MQIYKDSETMNEMTIAQIRMNWRPRAKSVGLQKEENVNRTQTDRRLVVLTTKYLVITNDLKCFKHFLLYS
jgi:hypothetical protein